MQRQKPKPKQKQKQKYKQRASQDIIIIILGTAIKASEAPRNSNNNVNKKRIGRVYQMSAIVIVYRSWVIPKIKTQINIIYYSRAH